MQHIRCNRHLLENNDSASHYSKYIIAPMWEIDIVHKRVPVVGVHGPAITRDKKLKTRF